MSAHERERLSAYLDGELAPAERAGVEAHLAACAECTAFLAELAAVDEAAAALPAEAPAGYFETFPARLRLRLEPRKPAAPVRRLPSWTWAVAAALVLAVVTPLTLREHGRPAPSDARSAPAQPGVSSEPARANPPAGGSSGAGAPADRSEVHEFKSKRAPVATPHSFAVQPRVKAEPTPANEPATGRDGGAAQEKRLAPPQAPAPRQQPTGPPPGAMAESESNLAVGGAAAEVAGNVAPEDGAPERDALQRAATPRRPVTAAKAPAMAAASADRDAARTSPKTQEDARRLEAARPRTAAGWRSVREQWSALAAAETDPARADEARVRAVVAAREAWRLGGDESDGEVFRVVAEAYLARDDARQKPLVERLLEEAGVRREP